MKYGIVFALINFINIVNACDFDDTPSSIFHGVNEFGYVSIWDSLGVVVVSETQKLPVNINFRSDRDTSSEVLGSGWFFPVLESCILQSDESTFILYAPNGRRYNLTRTKDDPSVLSAGQMWKAQIHEDMIDVYASCGWKLTYQNGRIIKYAPQNGEEIRVEFEGKSPCRLKQGLTNLLEVSLQKEGKSIKIGDKILTVKFAERPLVEHLQQRNIIRSTTKAASVFARQDFYSSFEFSVSKTVEPTLTLNGSSTTERTLTWDPVTRRIETDGLWTYTIDDPKYENGYAGIGRKHANGLLEYWYLDINALTEVTVLDGIKTVKSSFSSGPLRGSIRSIETFVSNKSTGLKKYIYDENGALSRINDNGKAIFEVASSAIPTKPVHPIDKNSGSVDKTQLSTFQSSISKLIETFNKAGDRTYYFDKNGVLLAEVDKYNNRVEYTRLSSGQIQAEYRNGKLFKEYSYDFGNNRLIKERIVDPLTEKTKLVRIYKYNPSESRTEILECDSEGNVISTAEMTQNREGKILSFVESKTLSQGHSPKLQNATPNP